MTLVSKRLPVLPAVLVGMAMAFAVWGLTPNAAFANDDENSEEKPELCLIQIGYEGALGLEEKYIGLDQANATLTQSNLKIRVEDTGGYEVNEEEYNLKLEAIWWDEEADREVPHEASLEEFGLMGDGAEIGITQFVLTATARNNSDYIGEVSTTFYLVDKYSLGWGCATTEFENCVRATNWRMRDWFWFRAGDNLAPIVTPVCGMAEPLSAAEHFTATYYYRDPDADMDAPGDEIDLTNGKVTNDQGQPAAPTAPGGYFVQIKGIAPYHGENWYPLDLVGDDTILFARTGDEYLWSDQEKKYLLRIPEGIDGKMYLDVGIVDDGGVWVTNLANDEEPDQYYSYDPGLRQLTLYGENVVRELGDGSTLNLHVQINDTESGELLAEGWEDVPLREARYQYDFPGDHDDLLPGWDGWIDNRIHVWYQNASHPEWGPKDLEVSNVEVSSSEPEGVLELTEEEGGWRYEAMKQGTATIELTYLDVNGAQKTYDIEVNVSGTVYHVDMWSEKNVNKGLPGTSIDLCASARKEWIEYHGDGGYHHEGTSENLEYYWEIVGSGKGFAEIDRNKNDHSKAVLTFNELSEGQTEIGERVKVSVTVYDKKDHPEQERASREEDFFVEDSYDQIYPAQIDSDLDVGKSLTIDPEVRHYELGQKDYSIVDDWKDVAYEFKDYDGNAIDKQEKDGVFTITRKGEWDTNFRLEARWNDGGTDQWYHLNRKDYHPDFGFEDAAVYDDCELTLEPRIEGGEGLEPGDYEIRYTVGRSRYDEENDTTIWDEEFDANSGLYRLDGDKLTIFGAKMAEKDLDGVNVRAEIVIGDKPFGDAWCWVNLRESCETWGKQHNWIKSVVKEPTLTEAGYEFWICPDFMFLDGCGEARLVEIPKLINISDATINAIPNKPYNAKAQTPALTVKYDGAALNAGTDYTAAYANNTKVGTATVTITGKGKYGGTKTATFKIVKAANPMVVKTKAVTIKASAVKKKNQTVKKASAFTVTKAQGNVTYKKKSGNSKITIASNGTITVKKGLKKGKYKFVVNVTAAGNANYNKITKAATVNITVK